MPTGALQSLGDKAVIFHDIDGLVSAITSTAKTWRPRAGHEQRRLWRYPRKLLAALA